MDHVASGNAARRRRMAGRRSLCAGGDRVEAPAPAVRDWTSLHVDVTQLIASRVLATGGFVDYVRFRAVCPHWRAAAAPPPRGGGGSSLLDTRFHPRRWMLFPEGFGRFPGHSEDPGHARFFDLSSTSATAAAFVRVPIPELETHCVLDSPDGLLLLQRDRDTAVRLLHPFTGDVAEFPGIGDLVHQYIRPELDLTWDPHLWYTWDLYTKQYSCRARKQLSSAVHVTEQGVVTVMLALPGIGRVAFASDGDDCWTLSNWELKQMDSALSYQGKIYVVNQEEEEDDDGLTHVLVIDPPSQEEIDKLVYARELPRPRTIATCSGDEINQPSLVELDSEIMLVGYKDRSFSRIVLLKLDLVLGRAVPVTRIDDDHVIFAGPRSLCVSSTWLPSIGGNSVVCFHAGENYLAQYDLGSGTWSPACDEPLLLIPPPRPCGLIHHIITCCYRKFWNKGLMFRFKAEPDWCDMPNLRNGA